LTTKMTQVVHVSVWNRNVAMVFATARKIASHVPRIVESVSPVATAVTNTPMTPPAIVTIVVCGTIRVVLTPALFAAIAAEKSAAMATV